MGQTKNKNFIHKVKVRVEGFLFFVICVNWFFKIKCVYQLEQFCLQFSQQFGKNGKASSAEEHVCTKDIQGHLVIGQSDNGSIVIFVGT